MNEIPFERPDEVWLLNLGYISDHSEQNLLLYGYISTPGVVNVELMINVEKKHVRYAIVLDPRAHRFWRVQGWLSRRNGLFSKLALFCFLRKFGSYDPGVRIDKCVKDYAGRVWSTSTEVLGVKQYGKSVGEGRGKGWFYKDGIEDLPKVST